MVSMARGVVSTAVTLWVGAFWGVVSIGVTAAAGESRSDGESDMTLSEMVT